MDSKFKRADPTAPTTPEQCHAALERQERVIARLREENDELRSDIQEMVKKAADNHLDGYRDLGARAAQAENERDELAARCERLGNKLQELLAHPENGQTRHEGHAVLAEAPASSLSHIRSEAKEQGAEGVRDLLAGEDWEDADLRVVIDDYLFLIRQESASGGDNA